jgi:uncharacterized membrane protein (DUF106 family)
MMTGVFLPLLINIILNSIIFVYVRSSSLRIHPQTSGPLTSVTNNQQPRITRRDISMLRQMIFMFSMFIGGWTPAFVTSIIDTLDDVDFLIVTITIIFSELCVLGIIINLFVYNHGLREYLANKFRVCFQR